MYDLLGNLIERFPEIPYTQIRAAFYKGVNIGNNIHPNQATVLNDNTLKNGMSYIDTWVETRGNLNFEV